MGHIEPTGEQMTALAGLPVDEPIVMLNLIRFRDRCEDDSIAAGMSGRESYRTYGRKLGELGDGFPGAVEAAAPGRTTVIGPADEQWDEVLLVRYPTVRSFIEMLSDPRYQEAARWRTAAVADSRLIALRG
jgi:uncharacterized protein (DUF1330 family)